MNYDGKTYRNLEGQVAYLTEVAEALDERITEVAAQIPSKMIVEELPEEGDPLITYYVGPKGTAPNYYYEVWVWVQEEEDGPFVWRELEDTDQVDLSGYLEKDETPASPYNRKVYGVNDSGEQIMITVSGAATAGNIPVYVGTGQLNVNAPTSDTQASNKKYVDDNFVPQDKSVTTLPKVYIKKPDGTQDTLTMDSTPTQGYVARFGTGGRMATSDPVNNGDCVNKSYADTTYVAKQTGTTSFKQSYAKNTDGTQYMQVINGKDMDAVADRIAYFGTDGRLRVGTPVNDKDAATKKYVDDAVGQLIYKHSITLSFTVNTRSFILNISLLNDDNTAYTSASGTQLLSYIQNGAYSIITNSYVNSSFWSVMVCPSDKYIHSDTGIGFILTAGADGSTIYVDGIDPSYNTDITGVTITDTVTTW